MEFYETVHHPDGLPLPASLQCVQGHTDAQPSCIPVKRVVSVPISIFNLYSAGSSVSIHVPSEKQSRKLRLFHKKAGDPLFQVRYTVFRHPDHMDNPVKSSRYQ